MSTPIGGALPPGQSQLALAYPLANEVAKLRARLAGQGRAHAALTLVKEPDVRIVLVVMRAGASVHTHIPHESVTIHVLDGSLNVRHSGSAAPAPAGTLLILGRGLPHDVEALSDSAFLAYMPWSSDSGGSPYSAEVEVDGTLAEGMPASDPPAWTSMHAGTPVRDRTKS
jgi:quercetin dioxygenase-like cupin family protein